MNIKFSPIWAPADDSGASNGGGNGGFSAVSAIPPPVFNGDESGDADSPDSDSGNSNTGNRPTGKAGSTLLKFVEDAEAKAKDEEEADDADREAKKKEADPDGEKAKKPNSKSRIKIDDDKEEDDSKKGTQKEGDSKDPTLEELLNTPIDKIPGANGKPLSPSSGKFIGNLKGHVQRLTKELEEAKKSGLTEEQKTQLTEVESLRAKVKEYESQIEEEHFENSPAFKEAFIAPVDKATKMIDAYFADLDPEKNKDQIKEIGTLFGQAKRAASEGNEAKFIKFIDEIIEDHIGGGMTIKAKFAGDALKWFNAQHDLVNALNDKGENRKKIVERKMAEARKNNLASIDNDVSTFVETFKAGRKQAIDSLPEDQRKEYLATLDGYNDTIRAAITDFQITGRISKDLAAIIQKGVIADTLSKESDYGWFAARDERNRNKQLQDEIESLKRELSRYTGEPRDKRGGYVKDQASPKPGAVVTGGERKTKSALWAEVEKIGADS